MAVHTKWCDAIATIFTAEKFCENFINEDNFNNTFFVKVIQNHRCGTRTDANLAKRCDIMYTRQNFLQKWSQIHCASFQPTFSYVLVMGVETTKIIKKVG